MLVACSVVPAGRPGRAPEPMRITQAEMEPVSKRLANAYDIVLLLRPAMLIVRGPSLPTTQGNTLRDNSTAIRVYVDDISVGGPEMLRTIPSELVVQVQWLSAIDATTRYGPGHGGGVIGVKTRSPR